MRPAPHPINRLINRLLRRRPVGGPVGGPVRPCSGGPVPRVSATALRPAALPAVLLAAALAPAAAPAACRDDTAEIRGPAGTARFHVELADTAAERARGLMHRDRLPAASGMLFVYEAPQPVSFWMRNTLIPLDMIFLDARGVIARIHENARPHDETAIAGGPGVSAVLEINGGLSRRLGIVPGAQIRHPAFAAGAAWPCAPG